MCGVATLQLLSDWFAWALISVCIIIDHSYCVFKSSFILNLPFIKRCTATLTPSATKRRGGVLGDGPWA